MALLKRDDVLALRLRHEDVEISPGVEIRVWELGAEARLGLGKGKRADEENIAAFLSLCLGDENGPFRPPLEIAEINARMGMALQVRLSEVARRVNAMTAASVEEERKNS